MRRNNYRTGKKMPAGPYAAGLSPVPPHYIFFPLPKNLLRIKGIFFCYTGLYLRQLGHVNIYAPLRFRAPFETIMISERAGSSIRLIDKF